MKIEIGGNLSRLLTTLLIMLSVGVVGSIAPQYMGDLIVLGVIGTIILWMATY